MSDQRDDIYSKPIEELASFKFDEHVAAVFPDMIQRSVPGYALIQEMIGVLSKRFIQDDSHVYDLGCSLGASCLSILGNMPGASAKLVGVDNSPAMIEGAKTSLKKFSSAHKLEQKYELLCQDILDIDYLPASFINLNFTLQFIEPKARDLLIKRLYDSLIPGGALIVSEKIFFEEREDQLQSDLHHAFKKHNGYSDLEISQKRSSLENVLIRDSEAQHHQRFKEAGFSESVTWFQCFNFCSLLAIKS